MEKTKKAQTINQLEEKLQKNHFYLVDSQGLNAQEVNEISLI